MLRHALRRWLGRRRLRAGLRLAARGRHDAAVAALERAAAARPDDPLPLAHLAQALAACGREADALAAARRAVALAADAPAVLLLAGETALDCGEPRAALDLFLRAVRRNPSNPLARAYAALARWRLSGDPGDLQRLRDRGLPDSVEFGARLLLSLEERLRRPSAPPPPPLLASGAVRRRLGARGRPALRFGRRRAQRVR